jgi:hypothetical protein
MEWNEAEAPRVDNNCRPLAFQEELVKTSRNIDSRGGSPTSRPGLGLSF